MKKTIRTTGIIILLAAMLAACAPAVGSSTQIVAPTAAANTAEAVQPNPEVNLVDQEKAYENIYELANPAVVNIQVVMNSTSTTSSQGFFDQVIPGFPEFSTPQESTPTTAEGSGFVYDTQGHIVTNNHVVEGASSIVVTFSDGSQAAAQVVGTDPGADLAVIKVESTASLPTPLTMADFSTIKVGQIVAAIGNPFGLQGSMSTGIVSGLGRMLSSSSSSSNSQSTLNFSIPDMIQTDTAINPGNSGGPLLNLDGEVIGVNTAIETTSGTNSGVGYAIPSSIVQSVADQLIKTGKVEHTWLGIAGTTLTANISQAMELDASTRGVLISEVTSGGPADNAGIQGSSKTAMIGGIEYSIGGDIITSIDGNEVKNFDDLLSYIFMNTQAGQKVELGILREGKAQTVTVTLVARPSSN